MSTPSLAVLALRWALTLHMVGQLAPPNAAGRHKRAVGLCSDIAGSDHVTVWPGALQSSAWYVSLVLLSWVTL
eukprot:141808-Pyramimonas_sp.AAC.1